MDELGERGDDVHLRFVLAPALEHGKDGGFGNGPGGNFLRGVIPADQDVRARPTAGMHPEIVRGCQLEKLGVPLGVAAPKEQEAVAAAERLYVLGQFRSAELRRGGRG